MSEHDGPTLRNVRESAGVPLRHVARLARMSHGHLSKVERGEHGRPVTPAVLAAYEKATGVRLAESQPTGTSSSAEPWRTGKLSDARRQAFNSQVAAVAVGGPLGQARPQLVDAIGPYLVPEHLDTTDADLVAQAARFATRIDLTHGGGLASQLTRAMLRWSIGLTKTTMTEQARTRLHTATAALAHRAGWAALDANRHDAARSLFTLALDSAIVADDRDLRAHVLADIAAQHNQLGHHQDATAIIELTEADSRLSPPVRAVLYLVKARAHAELAEADQCRRYIELAETCYADTPPEITGWQATITPAHLHAATGHAVATLATHTGTDTDQAQAIRRLTHAVDDLDPDTHTRAYTLCALRLAALQLPDDPQAATRHAAGAIQLAGQVRSHRVTQALGILRAAAIAHPQPAGTTLAEQIDQQQRSTGHQTDRIRITTQAGPAEEVAAEEPRNALPN